MAWLKRVELWVLLAVVAAGLVYVFVSRRDGLDETDAPGATSVAAPEDTPLGLHRCVLERDRDHARLEVEIRVRNRGGDVLALQPPRARLVAAQGREIAPFFLPFD